MKLLTKEIKSKLPPLNSQEENPDPVAQVKFFCPWNHWTWYAYEYDPEEKIFFGYVVGLESEFGSFSLEELESVSGPLGLKIERDKFWDPKPMSEIVSK